MSFIIKQALLINHKKNIALQLSNLKGLAVDDIKHFKEGYYPVLEKLYGKRVKEIVKGEEVTNWDLILTYQEK